MRASVLPPSIQATRGLGGAFGRWRNQAEGVGDVAADVSIVGDSMRIVPSASMAEEASKTSSADGAGAGQRAQPRDGGDDRISSRCGTVAAAASSGAPAGSRTLEARHAALEHRHAIGERSLDLRRGREAVWPAPAAAGRRLRARSPRLPMMKPTNAPTMPPSSAPPPPPMSSAPASTPTMSPITVAIVASPLFVAARALVAASPVRTQPRPPCCRYFQSPRSASTVACSPSSVTRSAGTGGAATNAMREKTPRNRRIALPSCDRLKKLPHKPRSASGTTGTGVVSTIC